jgi:hypothetical protein
MFEIKTRWHLYRARYGSHCRYVCLAEQYYYRTLSDTYPCTERIIAAHRLRCLAELGTADDNASTSAMIDQPAESAVTIEAGLAGIQEKLRVADRVYLTH